MTVPRPGDSSGECARRYHNDARIPAPAALPTADSTADPLAVLDAVIRQAGEVHAQPLCARLADMQRSTPAHSDT